MRPAYLLSLQRGYPLTTAAVEPGASFESFLDALEASRRDAKRDRQRHEAAQSPAHADGKPALPVACITHICCFCGCTICGPRNDPRPGSRSAQPRRAGGSHEVLRHRSPPMPPAKERKERAPDQARWQAAAKQASSHGEANEAHQCPSCQAPKPAETMATCPGTILPAPAAPRPATAGG